MSLRLIKQLETTAAKLRSTPDYCEHTFAEIIFPDNQSQTFAPCFRCSKPRLAAFLRYEDGRMMPRTLEAARSAFAQSEIEFPERSEAERRASVARAFGVDERMI